MPAWLLGPLKWLGGILFDRILSKLIELLKTQIRINRSKEENKSVTEEIKNAETEDDFKKAADRIAGHHSAD